MSNDEKRFVETYKQRNGISEWFRVFQDQETGVSYLLVQAGYGATLTPLLGRDGQPEVRPVPGPSGLPH